MRRKKWLGEFSCSDRFLRWHSPCRWGSPLTRVRAQDAAATAAPTDYANPAVWLCRPGREDACCGTTGRDDRRRQWQVDARGFSSGQKSADRLLLCIPHGVERAGRQFRPDHHRCRKKSVVNAQFARFAATVPTVFAPMYRQVTLTALRAMIVGQPIPVDRNLGYSDVLAAWNYYLAHDNQGRGVVLVGHSQGSGVLTRLIKEEIDGKPIESKLISAILMGTSLPVPKGADVGGAFQHIPVCRSNRQVGCVIAFADFRANVPPPANSRFGKAPEGMQAVCANPAALRGGSGMLNAYLSAGRISTGIRRSPRAIQLDHAAQGPSTRRSSRCPDC